MTEGTAAVKKMNSKQFEKSMEKAMVNAMKAGRGIIAEVVFPIALTEKGKYLVVTIPGEAVEEKLKSISGLGSDALRANAMSTLITDNLVTAVKKYTKTKKPNFSFIISVKGATIKKEESKKEKTEPLKITPKPIQAKSTPTSAIPDYGTDIAFKKTKEKTSATGTKKKGPVVINVGSEPRVEFVQPVKGNIIGRPLSVPVNLWISKKKLDEIKNEYKEKAKKGTVKVDSLKKLNILTKAIKSAVGEKASERLKETTSHRKKDISGFVTNAMNKYEPKLKGRIIQHVMKEASAEKKKVIAK